MIRASAVQMRAQRADASGHGCWQEFHITRRPTQLAIPDSIRVSFAFQFISGGCPLSHVTVYLSSDWLPFCIFPCASYFRQLTCFPLTTLQWVVPESLPLLQGLNATVSPPQHFFHSNIQQSTPPQHSVNSDSSKFVKSGGVFAYQCIGTHFTPPTCHY